MGTRGRVRVVFVLLLAFLVAAPGGVLAQAPPPPPPPAGQPPAPPQLRPEELDQLLAPIALYPDSLLAHVLMAATYPLEVVQAARWVKDNPSLKGDQVTAAIRDKPWDPSVKSLAQFPDVLGMLNERLDWTQKLGDAFLAQQRDLTASVQRLRKRAQEAGTLKTTQQQVVTVEKEVIIIKPASPQVIYVPSYDPVVVYGVWPYPAYPPPPPPPYYYPAAGIALGFAVGFVTGAALYGDWDWHGGGDVTINNNVNHYHNSGNINTGNINTSGRGQAGTLPAGSAQANTWKHDPAHRKGAPYSNPATAQRYGQTRPTTTQFSGDARGYGSGQGQGGGTERPAQAQQPGGQAGTGRAGGASTLESGRGQGGPSGSATQQAGLAGGAQGGVGGAGAGGGAFSGAGGGHSESAASQRGSSSRRSGGGGGRRR